MEKLKHKTVISTLSLFFQSGFSAFLGLTANIVVTILLSPAVFGIYIAILSMISVLNYFSDIGLAASLIQKKEITDDDVKTTFTVQQVLILLIIFIAYSLTPFIMNFYKLPPEGKYLYWALLLSFFLSSLKTIPSIFLERKVQFQKIVLVQVIENIVFYSTVIILAVLKFGLMSFVYAVFFRSIIGVIMIYSLSFWKPKIGISIKNLRQLLSFGLPFQASSFLALFKDDLIILYLGKILGFEALGYIGWAKKWAEAPIRIIMDNLSRVLFPVISRIQHDSKKISELIDKILHYQTLILAPSIVGLMIMMSSFVELIPKYQKWQPALPIFYIFCLSSLFSSYSTPFINLFNALGKVKISFTFMLIWTAMVWVLTTFLTSLFNYYGFPVAQLILSSTFILVIWQAKKLLSFNFIKSTYRPIVSASIMGCAITIMKMYFPITYISLAADVLIGSILYFTVLLLLFKINLINEVRSLFHA
ncbi:MAG: oligosaccharide flippase family protein [Patescibacteria group bacterium]